MPADPRKIWFPAKKYGWGWGWPCRWQGWVVMGVYFAAMVAGVFYSRGVETGSSYIVYVTVLTSLFGLICWRKSSVGQVQQKRFSGLMAW